MNGNFTEESKLLADRGAKIYENGRVSLLHDSKPGNKSNRYSRLDADWIMAVTYRACTCDQGFLYCAVC